MPSQLADCPVTNAEVDFVRQFMQEQFQLTPGPAHHWLIGQSLNVLDVGPFGIAMSKAGVETPIEQMIDNRTDWQSVKPFQAPWADREEFLNRLTAIRRWLDSRA